MKKKKKSWNPKQNEKQEIKPKQNKTRKSLKELNTHSNCSTNEVATCRLKLQGKPQIPTQHKVKLIIH